MSISDESIHTLLEGHCPANFHSPLRLAAKPSSKWLEKTIQSLAMTEQSEEGPVRLLYRSTNSPELSLHFKSYEEWIEKAFDVTWRTEPNWRQFPMNVRSTQLIKFRKRFRVLRGNCIHHFLVEKTQKLKLREDSETLLISQYSQKHGMVKLYSTASVCAIEGVFLVRNLHPDFDGLHVGRRSSTEKAICIVFREKLFPRRKTSAQGVTICFVGTIEKGFGFFEIHRSSLDAAEGSCVENESSSEDSDDEYLEPQQHPDSINSIDTQFQQYSSNSVNSQNRGLEYNINPEVLNVRNLGRVMSALKKRFSLGSIEAAFAEAESEILEQQKQEANGCQALRSYQQEAVEVVMQPGNYLLYAATGAGKTRIFIEVARRILESKTKALVVVVVPKIALTSQHAKDFEICLNQKCKYSIFTFCSGTTGNWERKWNNSNVAITTADYFANRLNRNTVKLSDIDLIILDEAHETKGNNPYFCIMSKYKTHIAENGGNSPKVFGVTATPARGSSKDRIEANMNTLLEILHVPEDHMVIINDDNKVILQTIPQAKPETLYVKSRTSDVEFIKFLAQFLRELITRTLPDHFNSNGLSLLNNQAPPSTYALLENEDNKGRFQQWKGGLICRLNLQDTSEVIKKDVEDSLWVICTIQETVDQCKDVGFEAALSDLNSMLLSKEREFSEAMNRVSETLESQDELLFFKLNAAFFGNHQVRMLNKSTPMAGSTAPSESGNFPKFAKLVEIIAGYKDREDIHGIVFVRTRLGAEWITNALQQSYLNPYFAFRKIVGRGKRNNSDRLAITGMSQNQLKGVLEWFKADGKKILVSTSVCEEGINVASCELIVRYNVPLTSIEYKQSLGRARKRDARFVNIIEKGSKEPTQLMKTEEEVKQSKSTMMSKPHAIHIR